MTKGNDPYCKGCVHYMRVGGDQKCCHYIFNKGHKRPCDPGKDCTVRETRKRGRKPKVRNDNV